MSGVHEKPAKSALVGVWMWWLFFMLINIAPVFFWWVSAASGGAGMNFFAFNLKTWGPPALLTLVAGLGFWFGNYWVMMSTPFAVIPSVYAAYHFFGMN